MTRRKDGNPSTPTRLWTDAEFRAAIEAYVDMAKLEHKNIRFVKKRYHEDLQEHALSNRTIPAIKRRMQNLTSIFEELGLPTVRGYTAQKNIGGVNKPRIIEIMKEMRVF